MEHALQHVVAQPKPHQHTGQLAAQQYLKLLDSTLHESMAWPLAETHAEGQAAHSECSAKASESLLHRERRMKRCVSWLQQGLGSTHSFIQRIGCGSVWATAVAKPCSQT